MPLRGMIGSDVLKYRDDWKTIDNPFDGNDPIVLLPAIKPDVALLHAPMADREGNVWIGRQRELATMAHAAAKTIATVEKIHDGNLLENPVLAAGTLPGFYVESVAVAERGAWPLPLPDYYGVDGGHMAEYVRMAATPEGFSDYLTIYVYDRDYENPKVRFPGSFGAAHLYYVVPKVILFRTEHSRRSLVPKVDFISAPGVSAPNVFRQGGPIALITNRCLFTFANGGFRLASVHPGHSVEEVIENTGFDFERPANVPETPAPSPATLKLLREVVAPQLAEVYPRFAAQVFGVGAAAANA
jgi:hypothetical protein